MTKTTKSWRKINTFKASKCYHVKQKVKIQATAKSEMDLHWKASILLPNILLFGNGWVCKLMNDKPLVLLLLYALQHDKNKIHSLKIFMKNKTGPSVFREQYLMWGNALVNAVVVLWEIHNRRQAQGIYLNE